MQPDVATLGFEHFIAQSDIVTKFLFIVLIAMSVISWLIIFLKSFQGLYDRSRTKRFLMRFWHARSADEVAEYLKEHSADNYHEVLADAGFDAVAHYKAHEGTLLKNSGSIDDIVTRTLRTKLDEIQLRRENGVTALASISATAPFVGLFGTVWGIYHALIEIGSTGAGTIDKVAGPVGEALIMTGVGLAVAIPAVLAHSWVARRNQVKMGSLDAFAFELLSVLGTGKSVAEQKTTQGGE